MKPTTLARAIYRDLQDKKTVPRSDEEHLSAAINWLYRTQDVTGCGGSAAYYSLLTGWAGPYPETTGYIIPTFYDYAEYADSEEAHERAGRMASWLLNMQLDNGAFPSGINPGPKADPSVFNTGQILFGLVRAYQETGDEEYRTAIEDAGRWLVKVQHKSGYWDRYDYRGEIHSYCSRVAWALLEAERQTGIDEFREAAVSNLDWVVSRQTGNYWFENAGFSEGETPFLHTLAYTIRGLLEGGLILDNDTYIQSAKATADTLLDLGDPADPLDGTFDESWTGADFSCLTGNAQTALIWLRLYEKFGNQRYVDAVAEEIRFLKTQHMLSGPPEVCGGVQGSNPVWGPYLRFRYPNWSVKFFLDCLLHPCRNTV
ncbi:prenyltransferase/squalene oxidase repeat-containing protein [Halorubellus salinus]|uniref:prenyltransferase/squalene oxidase repeat-containing protein n=1 Tax=Halorubellus salinus TaxID=755309 RepID=UPI001D05F17A|nr:prenyltransferase/squalene oxidase repeat-containing protein [Halorubellus salinus]